MRKCIILVLLFLCLYSNGQVTSWHIYEYDDIGLSSSSFIITDMECNSQGVKWFGTSQGTFLFNDVSWIYYDSIVPSGIAFDNQGNLWRSVWNKGVVKSDGTTLTLYNSSNSGLLSNYMYDVKVAQNGNIYATSPGKIYQFLNNNWVVKVSSDGNYVQNIAIDNQDVIWTSGDNGILSYNINDNSIIYYDDPNMGINCCGNNKDIVIGCDSTIWFVESSNLKRFDGQNWIKVDYNNSNLPSHYYLNMAAALNGQMWLGTNGTLASGHDSTWFVYSYENSGYPGSNVDQIMVDRNNKTWIYTQVYDTTGMFPEYKSVIINKGESFYFILDTIVICSGDSVLLQGAYQTMPGVYNDTLHSTIGIDSIISTTLNVNNLLFQTDSLSNANNGVCDGYIHVSVAGDTSLLSYYWNTGSTNQIISGLCSGVYNFTVNDIYNCHISEIYLIENTYDSIYTFVDTIFASADTCLFNDSLPVDSAYISQVNIVSSNIAVIRWVFWQSELPIYLDVEINFSNTGTTLVYLEVICGNKFARSSKYFNFYGVFNCLTNSLLEPEIASSFAIFPNPTHDLLTIRDNSQNAINNIKEVKITDMLGRTVYKNEFSNEINIETINLTSGIYNIVIGNTKNIFSRKVLIDR